MPACRFQWPRSAPGSFAPGRASWLEYHRGLLAIDRIKGTSALKDAERRKLTVVADHALALADGGKLHLLQERHGNGDYSYWAVARTPARPLEHGSSRFPIGQRSEVPRP